MERVGSSVGSPLRQSMKKEDMQFKGLPMGIWPCKFGCPLLTYIETVGSSVGQPISPKYEKVDGSVGSGVGCPRAARVYFAMQIRLPTTSIYGNSGQLSGQPTTSKYGKVDGSVGSGVGCPRAERRNEAPY